MSFTASSFYGQAYRTIRNDKQGRLEDEAVRLVLRLEDRACLDNLAYNIGWVDDDTPRM